jgi:hypothetical protein
MSRPVAVARDDDATAALEAVRREEARRIEAIRSNDTEAMSAILDDALLYITGSGEVYDKQRYIRAVQTHRLTYADDVELSESEYRADGDLVILAGLMRGHGRLDGDKQVFHFRSMRVWRRRASPWKLLAWQTTARG